MRNTANTAAWLAAFIALAGMVFVVSGAAAAVKPAGGFAPPAVVAKVESTQVACKGCGCRGGAGYRLPNGKCAARGR